MLHVKLNLHTDLEDIMLQNVIYFHKCFNLACNQLIYWKRSNASNVDFGRD